MTTEIQVGIIVGLFTLLGAFIPQYFQNESKKEERKQLELSKLEGLKVLIMQRYVSRFEAFIYSDYHEFRNKIQPNEHDFNEATRRMHKSEDLWLELAKIMQEFLSCLWMISVLFLPDKEIKKSIEESRLLTYSLPERPTNVMSLEELEHYKTKAVANLQKIATQEYWNKIETLMQKIKNKL